MNTDLDQLIRLAKHRVWCINNYIKYHNVDDNKTKELTKLNDEYLNSLNTIQNAN